MPRLRRSPGDTFALDVSYRGKIGNATPSRRL
jgi:hypothetical protein